MDLSAGANRTPQLIDRDPVARTVNVAWKLAADRQERIRAEADPFTAVSRRCDEAERRCEQLESVLFEMMGMIETAQVTAEYAAERAEAAA